MKANLRAKSPPRKVLSALGADVPIQWPGPQEYWWAKLAVKHRVTGQQHTLGRSCAFPSHHQPQEQAVNFSAVLITASEP